MSGLLDSRRWEVRASNREHERLLCEELGITPLVARILVARGVSNVTGARKFLQPSLERDWADPLEIPGMGKAADRIEQALDAGERIAVFGDFDVDGMTSTCLLTLALRELGGQAQPYIPHRFGEGYGLSREALNRVIADSHPDLVVTVDNGIAARDEVAWLREVGIDVVITDHHEPGELVPRGVPVTDPKLSADCSSRELAGAGVALKLVCELGRRRGMDDLWWSFTDLAALGTVSDMMLLQDENRSLVAYGLEQLRQSDRQGIVALAATANVDLRELTADSLPFSIIPRLNAAGRMGTTETAFDLLISDDPMEAALLAAQLEQTNTQRRETEASLSQEAMAHLHESYDGERVIVVAGEGWHEGVKGIVASRIVSKYHVPAIVFSITDGMARGSGRSVGSVDLFHAVEQCSDLLIRFGGHAGAVGVTCEEANIDAFRRRLQEVMAGLPEEQFVDRGEVAAMVGLGELTREGIDALECLQPFGQGNKRPLLGVRNVFMRNRARVGYEGTHLRFVATDGVASIPAIMFRAPHMDAAYACDGMVDLVVDAINETWQGRTHPKLMVRDILYRDASPAATDGDLMTQLLASSDEPRPESSESSALKRSQARVALSELAGTDLTERLRELMIGNSELLSAQREALKRLGAGRSTLCVMATGRGKSLIFHLHAARCALQTGQTSIFVYPLRALVSDQAFHLRESFARMGLSIEVLTGETPGAERERVYDQMRKGMVDVILTTPEYLVIHAGRLSQCARVGFLVVDEAHHAGTAKSGDRAAYLRLPETMHVLGDPVALATTATASAPVAREICRLLGIDESDVLVDGSCRENLCLDDHRDLRNRDTLLMSAVAEGEKTVVYVNSRNQAASVARTLRAGVPELGHRIAFYHAGLSRNQRLRVERAFRDGELCCIVSTSAFGEGVNLPGIRTVVLYNLPYDVTAFNQMSGRAGRDGREAHVLMLFGGRDAHINEEVLSAAAPARADLATLYRALMTQARRSAGAVTLGNAQILGLSRSIQPQTHLTDASVASGIAVFDELGLLTTQGFGDGRELRMVTAPGHTELTDSIRYAEGMHALDEFRAFRDWALVATTQEMLQHINKPIVPGFGQTVDR